jgi:hypothetical protein
MAKERPIERGARFLLAITALVLMALAIAASAAWCEEGVFGSRHLAKMYRNIGLDSSLNWIANNFERLHR